MYMENSKDLEELYKLRELAQKVENIKARNREAVKKYHQSEKGKKKLREAQQRYYAKKKINSKTND